MPARGGEDRLRAAERTSSARRETSVPYRSRSATVTPTVGAGGRPPASQPRKGSGIVLPNAPASIAGGLQVAEFIGAVKRTHSCGGLTARDIGREVVLFGWVHNRPVHGGAVFH